LSPIDKGTGNFFHSQKIRLRIHFISFWFFVPERN
jgi:hypothetical protein